jgi:HAD superfamily hydrolase (TIGR01509 family)
MDGVLIDSKEIHYESLNLALSKIGEKYVISRSDQEKIYDGISTLKKLELLTKYKGLEVNKYNEVFLNKQKNTFESFSNLFVDDELVNIIKYIKSKNISICVASNSIRNTVKLILLRLGLMEYIDYYVSNEDVLRPKPFPEMYWKCMVVCDSIPKNTVIFEDSEVGKDAAMNSGANLIEIQNRNDLSMDKVNLALDILGKL